ncbi:MAG: hypothetical protein RLO38_17255 [Roseovarius confluentis]
MFIVLLKFAANEVQAGRFMDKHNDWIRRGFEDGVFIMVGSLELSTGGAIIAYNTSLADLRSRVSEDPFVAKDIVHAEILEITPKRTDEKLAFLSG